MNKNRLHIFRKILLWTLYLFTLYLGLYVYYFKGIVDEILLRHFTKHFDAGLCTCVRCSNVLSVRSLTPGSLYCISVSTITSPLAGPTQTLFKGLFENFSKLHTQRILNIQVSCKMAQYVRRQ